MCQWSPWKPDNARWCQTPTRFPGRDPQNLPTEYDSKFSCESKDTPPLQDPTPGNNALALFGRWLCKIITLGRPYFLGVDFPWKQFQRLQNTSFCPDFFNSATKNQSELLQEASFWPTLDETFDFHPQQDRIANLQTPNGWWVFCVPGWFFGRGHRANHRSDTPHSGMINSTFHLGRLKAGFSPTILDDPNGQAWVSLTQSVSDKSSWVVSSKFHLAMESLVEKIHVFNKWRAPKIMNFQDLQPCGDLILQLKPMVLRVTHFPLNTEAVGKHWNITQGTIRSMMKLVKLLDPWSKGHPQQHCRIKTSNKSSLNHDPAIVAAEWSLITKKISPTKKKKSSEKFYQVR